MTNPAAGLALGASAPPHSQLHVGRQADAAVYQSPSGDDANSGYTMGTAKATLAAAIAALPSTGGRVQMAGGVNTITAGITIDRPVLLQGSGVDRTILRGGVASGYTLSRFGTGSTIGNIEIADLTIDLQSVAGASGIGAEYVTDFALRRLKLLNSAQWAVRIGVNNGADGTIRNSAVTVEDVTFDGQTNTTEALLLYNSRDVTVRRNTFTNLGASAYGIGLYQNLDQVLIDNNRYPATVGTGLYYSLSCNNLKLVKNKFYGGCVPIRGANQSDNGAFGASFVSGLLIEDNYIFSNIAGTACQVGAAHDYKLIGNTFRGCREIALGLQNGNTPVNGASLYGQIIGNTFRENNQAATSHILHPAVQILANGDLHIEWDDDQWIDDQGTKTQRYPIVVEGAITPARMDFVACRLWADTANGGTSIAVNDGATFGAAVRLLNCRDVSTTLPAGVLSYNSQGRDPLGPTTPTVSASPWTYTAGQQPEVLHLRGGTVSNISKNGTQILAASPASIPLQPGESVVVTYSSAPTAVADRK